MPRELPEGRFRFLEWEEMNGGEFHQMHVEDREMGYACLACCVEDLGEEGLRASVRDNVDGYEAASTVFRPARLQLLGQAKAWCEEKAVELLREGVGWTPHEAIDGAAVAKGMLAGAVALADGPGGGTVCRIGGNWFHFDTPDADGMDPAAYVEAKGADRAAELIAEALGALAESDPDEHAYYAAVLREAGCL